MMLSAFSSRLKVVSSHTQYKILLQQPRPATIHTSPYIIWATSEHFVFETNLCRPYNNCKINYDSTEIIRKFLQKYPLSYISKDNADFFHIVRAINDKKYIPIPVNVSNHIGQVVRKTHKIKKFWWDFYSIFPHEDVQSISTFKHFILTLLFV